MTIMEAIKKGMIELKNANIETPKLKARLLMQFTLNKPRQYIIVNDLNELTVKEENQYFSAIKKMRQGVPLEHINHQREFMKLNFLVTKDVLIPRPDTEILVEEIIRKAENIPNPVILDLCTGSGAIAVSLAKYIKNVHICAVDISSKALEIAKKNAELNGVKNNIEFIESNLFDKIKERKFDIIVSNPPYIETETIKTLSKDVQSEPKIALDGGKDGLDFYRKIADSGSKYLNRQGYICLEIGYNQRIAVRQILENKKRYVNINCIKDLCGNDRVVTAQIG